MLPSEPGALCLEPLVIAHADEMFDALSAAAIYDYMPGAPPASPAALRERYASLARGKSADGREQWLNWIIRLPSGGCAGFVQATLHPGRTGDFAYVLAPEHWGRGVAFEACRAAISILSSKHEVARLYATVDPRNLRSLNLLAHLGFAEIAAACYPHGDAEPGDRVFLLSCRE
jgi:[ribosomal protein S5]-alanine N-acetyltransferase